MVVVGKGRNLYCMVVRKEKGSLFFSSKTNKAKKSIFKKIKIKIQNNIHDRRYYGVCC